MVIFECEKMPGKDMLALQQRVVLEFLVKEGIPKLGVHAQL
jgi:hypothetical protein